MKTEAERERAGSWVWVPDAEHAFVPGKRLETFYDGRVEVEREDGSKLTVAKNVLLEELTWSSLRRPVRDLVMLDVMNQPLILHNLKSRFSQNEIYVRTNHIGGAGWVFFWDADSLFFRCVLSRPTSERS